MSVEDNGNWIVITDEHATREDPLVYNAQWKSYPGGVGFVNSEYCIIENFNSPDNPGQTGVAFKGGTKNCIVRNGNIGSRYCAVSVKEQSCFNVIQNISICDGGNGVYFSEGSNDNIAIDIHVVSMGKTHTSGDRHSLGCLKSHRNKIIRLHDLNSESDEVSIICQESFETQFIDCTSFGSRSGWGLMATIRSDGTVIQNCHTDGVLEVKGTPNARIIGCTGDIRITEGGPNSDITGILIAP